MRGSDRMDEAKPQRAIGALQHFLETPLNRLLERSSSADPAAEALTFFREVATRVPAYRRFLDEHGIDPASIRSPADFARLPLTDKANYLLRHPLADLCRDGRLESCDMMAVSSGSTGKPTFWPRFVSDELVTAVRFEQAFHDSFAADRRRTLAVVCFALGTWVGGLFTTACCRYLAAKGYPLIVAAPGNNKPEIWRVIRELAPQFEQTVLLGYPPFLKDVIDGGIAEGIDWHPFRLKLVMTGEVFSEEWRDLVGERAGITDPIHGSVALYGTADAGVLGNETPLSIAIRRFLGRRPEASRELFGESRLPTLVQYDPLARYFEARNGTLLFSGSNGVPLLRYHIADNGGIVSYEEMLQFLAERGFDPIAALSREGEHADLRDRGARPLPFVYVFGRSNFTVSYFGANIYPENITVGLEQPQIASWVTGKFVLQAVEGLDQAPHLAVAVELAPGVQADDRRRDAIAQSILAELLRLNSEFQAYTPTEYRLPRVTLKPTGDPDWFPVGVKHRYTRK
jgi:phenylacetate-coenzyme A ligase PaaK-like adenylate-forming protein